MDVTNQFKLHPCYKQWSKLSLKPFWEIRQNGKSWKICQFCCVQRIGSPQTSSEWLKKTEKWCEKMPVHTNLINRVGIFVFAFACVLILLVRFVFLSIFFYSRGITSNFDSDSQLWLGTQKYINNVDASWLKKGILSQMLLESKYRSKGKIIKGVWHCWFCTLFLMLARTCRS